MLLEQVGGEEWKVSGGVSNDFQEVTEVSDGSSMEEIASEPRVRL